MDRLNKHRAFFQEIVHVQCETTGVLFNILRQLIFPDVRWFVLKFINKSNAVILTNTPRCFLNLN